MRERITSDGQQSSKVKRISRD
ncbi:hypothetical protein R3I93_018202 [Phoxinus phoxinus]|uniref:Uncharacterized protein n=1 Tax=Phoxinus phoxinus TaxID=58324 RepID=A0AAN9GXX4_9TELE